MKAKIDYKEIIKLIDLLEERNLSHFELEIEGLKIKISRNLPQTSSTEPPPNTPLSLEVEEKRNLSSPELKSQENQNNIYYIKSPMVGTFYNAPDPASPPFVNVGDAVKKDQTLCIIEAMKLMNEIESDVNGILKEIYIENGRPVEYGQKLFAIQFLS